MNCFCCIIAHKYILCPFRKVFSKFFQKTAKIFHCGKSRFNFDEINDKINDKIKDLDTEILKLLADNCYMTIPELAKSVSKSEPTIYRHLDAIIKAKKIERVGSRKNGYWRVINTD